MKITRRQLRRIIKEAVLREGNSTDPRGLKALLASLNVKGQEFKALAGVLSTTYHDFEGGPEDMKDEVEVNSDKVDSIAAALPELTGCSAIRVAKLLAGAASVRKRAPAGAASLDTKRPE